MGKGDARRPTLIDDRTFSMNWCRTHGHKMRSESDRCINCGATAKEIVDEHQGLVQAPAGRRRRRSAKDAEQ